MSKYNIENANNPKYTLPKKVKTIQTSLFHSLAFALCRCWVWENSSIYSSAMSRCDEDDELFSVDSGENSSEQRQ